MHFLQQVVELRAIPIGQTDEFARGIHSRCAGEVGVSTLLTKMLFFLRVRLLITPLGMNGRSEVNHRLALMTRFAQHRLQIVCCRCVQSMNKSQMYNWI